MASKSFDAIVSDIINNILIVNPSADVKVGSVIRDIFIDVQALQIQSLYNIADSSSRAQSILTARNNQLDRLGYNFNITRSQPQRSVTNIVINVQNGVQAPTPLNIGDQFYTQPDQYNQIQTFLNTQLTLLTPGQTQVTLPVIAQNPGSAGNVAAYTITQSSYDFADSVYNPLPAIGGTDIESDPSFALRIPLQVTGQYVNTFAGIVNTVKNVQNIIGQPFIVTPDNPASRGQYTVDVYLQRNASYFGTPVQETAPANAQDYTFQIQPLYLPNPINQISVYNPVTQQFIAVPQISNDIMQFAVLPNPADAQQFYAGTTKAGAILHWFIPPPTLPYQISYNIDQTVIDAQDAFDVVNEITDDILFKQGNDEALYISAVLNVPAGTDPASTFQNANTNTTNLFNQLKIAEPLSDNQVEFAFLNDPNVLNVSLSNLDTTYSIPLTVPILPSAAGLIQSEITPLGYYWETDVPPGPITFYTITDRLWIGNPDIINTNNLGASGGFNLNIPTLNSGVTSENLVSSYVANWQTSIYPFYDSVSQTLILNFTTSPPVTGAMVVLNLVQQNIQTLNNLSYLGIAPSLVSPIQAYSSTINTSNPQYATILPTGLLSANAQVYQNGIALTSSTTTTVGDYVIISGPDPNTGLVTLQFTQPPANTDVLQYGLLNPNISISYSSQAFR